MSRTVTFDLDKMIAGAKILAEDGPGLINMLGAIWPGAAKASTFAPMLTPLAAMADKFASINSADGGFRATVDTGPLGRGRLSYLKRKSSYSDEDVVWAVEQATSAGTPACNRVVDTINYTLKCMFKDVNDGDWTVQQNRAGIDQVLEMDGMSEGVCDRLGDMIMFCLKNKPKPQPAEPESKEQP